MPYNPPSDGDVLTASLLLDDVWDQVTAQVTSGSRPTGTEGQVIYETDTNRFQAHNGSTWVQWGQLGVWTPWAPTLTQSGAVTYTATHSAYTRLGSLIIAHCTLAITGAGTANNAVTVTLPVTAVAANAGWGTGIVRDVSAASMAAGVVALNASTTAVLRDATQPTNALVLGQTGASFALGLAAGDTVQFGIIYEAA